MGLKLEDIRELPTESHSFFLLPLRRLTLQASGGGGPRSELFFRECGTGKPVLLLHGLWTSAYTFRSLITHLKDRFRLILPELTHPDGFGIGTDSNHDFRPEEIGTLIGQIGVGLELDRPLVVAHGECGLAGMLFALEHPSACSGLVTLGMPFELPARLRLRGWMLGRKRSVDRWARKGFARPWQTAIGMLDYADPTLWSRQEIRLLARHWATLRGARSISRILAQTLSRSYRERLNQALHAHLANGNAFPVPLKLVYGDADRRAPLAQGQKLNRLIPGSELLVAERSGGAVHVEKPEWTARIITASAGS